MTPTNRLRFIKRSTPCFVDAILSSTQQTVLQQWWEEDGGNYDGLGEWRDVPIEEQA